MNRAMPLAAINRFSVISPMYRSAIVVMTWSLNVMAKSASLSNGNDIARKGKA